MVTFAAVSSTMKGKVVSVFLLLLILGKVSTWHVYSHMLEAETDCTEHCDHCEEVIVYSFAPTLTSPEVTISHATPTLRIRPQVVNLYHDVFFSNTNQGQYHNRPPPFRS